MGYDAKTERLIALKKLAGKAQTSNDKGLANEALPSGITSTSETIFGEAVTASPSSTSLYTITGKVEYLRFQVSFIAGSDTITGRHGFELKLPADYEANSTNSKAGTGVFVDDGVVNASGGILQIVPPSFATAYEAKPYYGGSATKGSGTQIPLLDPRDWYLDYFNGVFFQQDPPGSGDHANNPDYIEAFLYIGDMVDTVISNNAGGGTGDNKAEYLVLTPTGSLQAERVFNPTTGLVATDAGAGGNYTLKIRDSIVATLTGSQFSGNVGVTGSLGVQSAATFNAGLSGSLTQLSNGTSYLRAGANITIASASNGSVLITGTSGGTDRSKDVYFMNSDFDAGSAVSVSSSDFSTALFDPNKIDIFLNGQLVHSGSVSQVNAGSRDYYISSSTSLRFSFKIVIDDILDVVVFSAS